MLTKKLTKKPTKKPRPRKGRPPEIGSDCLLDAAEKLFAEKGFEGTTTRELGRLAGCNQALIAYRFGSKDGLYQAVLQRHFQAKLTRYSGVPVDDRELAREWPELKDPEQRRFCAAFFALARGAATESPMQKIMCREMMTGAVRMVEVLKNSEHSVYRVLSLRIEELKKRKILRADLDLRYAVLGLFGSVVYSCIASPMLKEVYGFKSVDDSFLRELCLHQTRVFFEGVARA